MWMEVAVVAMIFAGGNLLALTLGISAGVGRAWAVGFLGLLGVVVLIVHGWWLPRNGINGWTGEPKEKYYALRGWKYPPS